MPFKSKAQARFMFAKHPKMAKEFASKTKSIASLPEHVNKENTTMKASHHKKAAHHMKKAEHHHKKAAHHMKKMTHESKKMHHKKSK